MDNAFFSKTAKVAVVDPTATRRLLIADVVKAMGFAQTETFSSGKELLTYLETERVDWIILPLMADEEINALQLLKTFTTFRKFRTIRVSIITQESELPHLP